MNILRRVALTALASLLSLSVLGMAWSHVALSTVRRPDTVKSWLTESGFYDKTVDALLESASQNDSNSSGSLPVDDPEIKRIANDAFSPDFLKDMVEQVLDGSYAWLEGKTSGPEFSVDLSAAKQKLAKGVGEYATRKANALPACTSKQLRAMAGTEFDVFSAGCLPPGINTKQVGAELSSDILSDDFLGDSTFSGSDIKVTENGQELSVAMTSKAKDAQKAYGLSKYGPAIFGVLAALCAIGIFFLSGSKRRGFNRVGVILITNGFFVGLAYLAVSRGTNWLADRVSSSSDTDAGQEIGAGLARSIGSDVSRVLMVYAVIMLVVGTALIVLSRFVEREAKPVDPSPPSDEPKVPAEGSAKTPQQKESPKEESKGPDKKDPPKIQL